MYGYDSNRTCNFPKHSSVLVGVAYLISSAPPPVVLLSEDRKMSTALKKRGITAETLRRAEQDPTFPIRILPAPYLPRLYQELGGCI